MSWIEDEGIRVFAATDTGRVREVNEDSMIARDPLFLVADGMGGHARGDVASQTAIAAFESRFPERDSADQSEVLETVQTAHVAVRKLSSVDDVGTAVAGTTLTGVIASTTDDDEPVWMIVNAGDSRTYAWDGSRLEQVTVDHSAVQELIDAGVITPDQAATHPERNAITRALGADDEVSVDVFLVHPDDVGGFLVCSDGIGRELSDERIASILAETDASGGDPAAALVDAALREGARDNVTAIVVVAGAR